MTQSPIAAAADYAEAILVSRRAKNWIFWLLLLTIVSQLGVFLAARFTNVLPTGLAEPAATSPAAASQTPANNPPIGRQLIEYIIHVTVFAGVILGMLLVLVLVIIVNIMLVARLIGLGPTVGALTWAMVLLAILFPWQVFVVRTATGPSDLRIPGVLYAWNDLVALAHFPTDGWANAILKWSRFVVFPLVAIILLLRIQFRSRRGIGYAIGETTPPGAGEAAPRPK